MSTRFARALGALASTLLVAVAIGHGAPAGAQTSFTYQGQLKSAGAPYSGTADLRFTVYNAVSGGSLVGAAQSVINASITEGIFTAQLNFGALVFDGAPRWLLIEVRTPSNGGAGPYTPLTPRQPVNPAPYAMYALNANTPFAFSGANGIFNSAGNVGVGTSTPTAGKFVVQTAANAPGVVHTDGTRSMGTSVGPNGGWLGTITNDRLNFGTNGAASQMVLSTAGEVGLGTTTPNGKLQIVGGPAWTTHAWNKAINIGNGHAIEFDAVGAKFGMGATNGLGVPALRFFHTTGDDGSTDANYSMVLTNAGTVGIGGSAPYRLTVNGAGYGLVQTDGVREVGTYVDTSGGWLGTRSNHPLLIFTNNGFAQANFGTNGNFGVGAGPAPPSHRLTVQSADAETVRLIGPLGTFQHGARLNFGDGDFAFIDESSDDFLRYQAKTHTFLGSDVTAMHVSNSNSNGFGISTFANGVAVAGNASGAGATGVWGIATAPSTAVHASGNMSATGFKSFRIDHPFDPENKYLYHYCTESSEPLNVYSGNVMLNGAGEAAVQLPAWFESINRDFRYQLTAIGAPGPNLHIAQEVVNNFFVIAGGQPGTKVSWRIEATRNDRHAQTYGAPVEQDKPERLRGTYQQPELYGQGADRSDLSLLLRERPAALKESTGGIP